MQIVITGPRGGGSITLAVLLAIVLAGCRAESELYRITHVERDARKGTTWYAFDEPYTVLTPVIPDRASAAVMKPGIWGDVGDEIPIFIEQVDKQ